jgi:hypothetical protein
MDAVTYYLTIAPVWLLPTLAVVMSVLTFHYTGISFLHWIATIFWFVCGYYLFNVGIQNSLMVFHLLGLVSAVLGMIMVFAPFFLSAKKEPTIVDDADSVTKYMIRVERETARIDQYRRLRPQKRIPEKSSDGRPLL